MNGLKSFHEMLSTLLSVDYCDSYQDSLQFFLSKESKFYSLKVYSKFDILEMKIREIGWFKKEENDEFPCLIYRISTDLEKVNFSIPKYDGEVITMPLLLELLAKGIDMEFYIFGEEIK